MAKKKNEPTTETTHPSDANQSGCSPEQPGKLDLPLITLDAGTVLHRIHMDRYKADQFNPGVKGHARFSPIKDEDGKPVPTMYAGETMECALMETIFHDVPFAPGLKTMGKSRLVGQVHSQIELTQPLRLGDLSSIALRKHGIQRKDLIDTESSEYEKTQKCMEQFRADNQDMQGAIWTSRQHDKANAVVFFNDRIPEGAIIQKGTGEPLLDLATYNDVLDLATRLDVDIVDDTQ